MTASKTLLRFFILLLVTTVGMFYLAAISKVSAQNMKLQEKISGESLLSETSSTEFIFLESVSRFLAATIHK